MPPQLSPAQQDSSCHVPVLSQSSASPDYHLWPLRLLRIAFELNIDPCITTTALQFFHLTLLEREAAFYDIDVR